MDTPVQQLEKATAELSGLKAELATLKADAVTKGAAIEALTKERDTFKGQAEASTLKVSALEAEKGTLSQSIKDVQGKLDDATAKLKDPSLLAAAGKEHAGPIGGMSAGADQTVIPLADQVKALEAKIKAESDPVEKAKLRAQLNKLN